MKKIIYFVGRIVDKLMNCRAVYLEHIYTTKVDCTQSRCHFGPNLKLGYPENIHVGLDTYINGEQIIASKNAEIIIGNNCLISYDVHIRTSMHQYSDRNTLINQQGDIEKSIIIGDDVWIGYGAQILAGVKISNGCVIGAGAIVTKDTEPYGVYVGVPARLVKYRQ